LIAEFDGDIEIAKVTLSNDEAGDKIISSYKLDEAKGYQIFLFGENKGKPFKFGK
jgi:hypothetical protein